MKLRIRPASSEDLELAVALLSECDLPTVDLDAEGLAHFLVAHAGETDSLVGVIGLEPYEGVGLLRSLAVSPRRRGHGVAEALVTALERRARGQGIAELYLLTTTAASYFERRDYRAVDRSQVPQAIRETREFAGLCPDSALVMRKNIESG